MKTALHHTACAAAWTIRTAAIVAGVAILLALLWTVCSAIYLAVTLDPAMLTTLGLLLACGGIAGGIGYVLDWAFSHQCKRSRK